MGLSLTLVTLLGGLIAAPMGAAAEPEPRAAVKAETLAPLDPAIVKSFKLSTLTAQWDKSLEGIKAIEASGAVTKVTPLQVATSGQHKGRAGLCHGVAPLETRLVPDGFCWDQKDEDSSAYTFDGGWMPQGLTASHDSTPEGTVDGNHLYLAAWQFGTCFRQGTVCDPKKPGESDKDQFARISIVKNTGGTAPTYGHVLLVKPNASGTNFEAVTETHADGMVWYGNRLFVANGGELQVYDMRHLWRMTNIDGKVGTTDGKTSSARWHQWAMPMIGRYFIDGTPAGRTCAPGGSKLCLSSLSLDRSKYPDALVSSEHVTYKTSKEQGTRGRVVRWPLNAEVALPKADNGAGIGDTTASAAYKSPVWAQQGAATDGTYYYMSGACPDSWPDEDGSPPESNRAFSCIHRAKPGEAPVALTKTPRLTQNLSYAPNSGRLWGLNESLQGDRSIFSLKVH